MARFVSAGEISDPVNYLYYFASRYGVYTRQDRGKENRVGPARSIERWSPKSCVIPL